MYVDIVHLICHTVRYNLQDSGEQWQHHLGHLVCAVAGARGAGLVTSCLAVCENNYIITIEQILDHFFYIFFIEVSHTYLWVLSVW